METIRFGTDLPELSYYETRDWLLNESRTVEFFPNKFYEVTLISTSDDTNILKKYLSRIDTKSPIAIDLEWEDELCLFQFCFDTTVVIIRHPKGDGNIILFNFLRDHFFYGKGINHDLQKLYEKFKYDFKNNIEDIARTRLEPYGHSINFVQMTHQFAGRPTAEFKDVRITKSNWDLPELSMRQVLYAAFDVVAICVAYPNFPPAKEMIHEKKKSKTGKKIIRKTSNEKDMKRKHDRLIKQKFETSERILWHNRIVLKQSQAKKTFCYLVSNYEGPSDCITLKKVLFGSFLNKDIDHVGCVCIDNKKSIIISLFVDHPELLESKSLFEGEQIRIEKLNTVDPNDCTDNDVLFIPPLSSSLNDEISLSLLFYAFGVDIRFNVLPDYIRIQPHRAQQSFIVKTFFPTVVGVPIHTFPDFYPVVRAFLPPQFDEDKIKGLFLSNVSDVNDVKVTLLRRKTENSEQNALIQFDFVEKANEAVEKVNYKKVGDFTCYAQRFTDENHIRFLRFFELTVDNNIDYSKGENSTFIEDETLNSNFEVDVRKRYSKYGQLFQCKYDKIFNVYRVQFIDKNDAIKASENEKNASFPPTGTMAFVRNLPFTITDDEVLNLVSPYGKVLGFVYREIDEFMRNLVVEVMYTSVDEAHAIKKALHQKKIYGEELEINVINTLETEAPIWKMQQRKLYVKLNALNDPTQLAQSENAEKQNPKSKKNSSKNQNKPNRTNALLNDNSSNQNLDDESNHDQNELTTGGEINRPDKTDKDEPKEDQNEAEEKAAAALYSASVDHAYYIANHLADDDDESEEKVAKVTAIGPFELLQFLARFGHVIDIKDDYALFLNFNEAAEAQSSIEGSSLVTTNEFVNEIFPGDFSVINVEYLKKPFRQSQPMAVIIDPLPDGLTEDTINGYLEGVEGYFIVIDEIDPESQARVKMASRTAQNQSQDKSGPETGKEGQMQGESCIHDDAKAADPNLEASNEYSEDEDSAEDEEDMSNQTSQIQPTGEPKSKHVRAIVYVKSKRAMNIVHSKLHNQSFNGELLDLSKYAWNRVPQRPKNLHPFAELNPPRKQPIIVDPVPIGTKAIDVRKACEGCGKFDVKIEGSSEKVGMCRAVVQPRNMKAKVNCLLALENKFGQARRYPRDEVPPVLQENLEEESDYE